LGKEQDRLRYILHPKREKQREVDTWKLFLLTVDKAPVKFWGNYADSLLEEAVIEV